MLLPALKTRQIILIFLVAGILAGNEVNTLSAGTAATTDSQQQERGRPLFSVSLEDLSKDWPELEILYGYVQQHNAAKSEETLLAFFKKVIRPPAAKPEFQQSFAFAPAKFIGDFFPDEVAVPILERMKRNFPGPEYTSFRSAINRSILDCYVMAKKNEAAVAFAGQMDPQEKVGSIEETIFGLSSRLLEEGKPDMSALVCSNFFGSIDHAVPAYCTNSIYFNHLAAIESALGNSSGIIHIYESMRTNKPSAYAESIYHNNGALSQAYASEKQHFKIATLLASDMAKIADGTFRVSESDRKSMEAQVVAFQKQGWLDRNRKAVNIENGELPRGRTIKVGFLIALLLPTLCFGSWLYFVKKNSKQTPPQKQ